MTTFDSRDHDDAQLAFGWNGLPQYGARLLAAAFRAVGHSFPVVASRPEVPIQGMEEHLGSQVDWIDPRVPASWHDLQRPVPQVYFQPGWAYPAFNRLGDEVRANGGRVCLVFDNNRTGALKQRAGAVAFRATQLRRYSAAFVPGKSGRDLARAMGFPAEKIWTGLYGADDGLFTPSVPLRNRPKVILFVGQYIQRKGCVPFAEAFASVSNAIPDWEIHLYGQGEWRSRIPLHPQIKVSGFTQPEDLAGLYQNARVLALPSFHESWGLVVHEACLTGCQLLLSDRIGSAADFATPENALLFRPGQQDAMSRAILEIANRSASALDRAEASSLEVARTHGPSVFARNVKAIYATLAAQIKAQA